MPATLINQDALTAATDAELDAALRRLWDLHYAARLDERALVHAEIVVVLGEISRRRDAWLAGMA